MAPRRRRIDSPPEDATAQLVVRRLDPDVKEALRLRAIHNRRSLEAEVRAILTEAVRVAEPEVAIPSE